MTWENNTFPDADDPNDVQWIIMYWRTVKCTSGCTKQDYRLESRQFDHLPKGTTLAQARVLLKHYTDQRRASGDQVNRKNQSLFLCKVMNVHHIHDNEGNSMLPQEGE
jgi:hypothetical protein